MRALILSKGSLRVKEVPDPQPGPGEALVKVLTAGICNTDLELARGYMNFNGTLGHEFVGVVQQAENAHLVGKRVVGEINCVCHQCQYCQMEMPHHCLNRSVIGILNRDGAFAEYLTLPEENLHIAPASVRDDVAVFAEPAAAAFRILEQVEIQDSDHVIVLGDGKLGQLIAQVLWLHTKNLVCVGKHPWKLKLLSDLGIKTALMEEPIVRGADVVVEATGSHLGFARALELVRPEGTVILKTTVAHPTALEFSSPVINEIRILGSRCGPFRPALEALSLGTIGVQPLITDVFSLVDADKAMARAAEPGVMKVLLHI
jgi:threonine dehydrogenase-like Zn-dependent dehydrogenase